MRLWSELNINLGMIMAKIKYRDWSRIEDAVDVLSQIVVDALGNLLAETRKQQINCYWSKQLDSAQNATVRRTLFRSSRRRKVRRLAEKLMTGPELCPIKVTLRLYTIATCVKLLSIFSNKC